MTVEQIIERLDLSVHPEGGFFKETYRADMQISVGSNSRNVSTGIYYLLDKENISHLHRIKSDEMWHFYSGSPLRLILFNDQKTEYKEIILSNSLEVKTYLQYVIPAGVWMAAEVTDKTSYSLVGCTVSPGFDFTDFEMANINVLDGINKGIQSKLEKYIFKI